MQIPFFNYKDLYNKNCASFNNIFQDICSRGSFILQQELELFEEDMKRYLNVKHAFGVANGTDALIIALRAAGIKQGDEVILPSHTYIATAAAVHFVNAVPILAECGYDHMLDPAKIEQLITPKTKAIMPVQLNGRVCNMKEISFIAEKHNLLIIEDAAQAFGAKFQNKNAGTFGLAGTFSFYPAKVLGCFGDGGAIVTNDSAMAEKISLLRDHGRDKSGKVVAWGLNSRLDNLQAAILAEKLKNFPLEISKRREIANIYNNELKNIKECVLPPSPEENSDNFDIYQNYEIEVEQREDLMGFLLKNGIKTLVQWGGSPVHHFKELGFNDVKLPFTDNLFKKVLMLPMNTSLTNEEVYFIIKNIKNFYGY